MRVLLWSMKDVRDVIEGAIANDFDFVMFVEGKTGMGKSTFILKLLSQLNIKIPFQMRRDILYGRNDVLKHLASKQRGVIFADEMINVGFNRDFYNEEQKILVKALNMYRDSCNFFVGAIPRFAVLDTQLQGLCKMRISVIRRGIALIQTQNSSIYSSDPWDIKNNQRIESKWTEFKSKNPKYSQLTTVRGIVRFGDISETQRALYKAIKAEKRNKVFGNYTDDALLGDPEKLFFKNLVEQIKAYKITPESLEMIAKVNNREVDSIRKIVNSMLKKEGDDKRCKDYILSEKKKDKKDKLGFTIQAPNTATEGTKEEKPQEDKPEEAITGDNEDIFGFKV